jgi:TatD DNase family protein
LNEKAKATESFEYLPIESIFFETDEMEGEIAKIYEKGASVKKTKMEKLREKVLDNFNRIENIQWSG